MGSNFGQILRLSMELAALERLNIDVTSFSWALVGCLFNLQVMMTFILDKFEF